MDGENDQPGTPGEGAPTADRVGILLAAVCLVHCMGLPVVLATLPAMAALWGGEWVHIVLVGLAVPVSGWALVRGVFRHKDAVVALQGLAGLGIIVGATFAHVGVWVEVPVMIVGTVILLLAHQRNLRVSALFAMANPTPA